MSDGKWSRNISHFTAKRMSSWHQWKRVDGKTKHDYLQYIDVGFGVTCKNQIPVNWKFHLANAFLVLPWLSEQYFQRQTNQITSLISVLTANFSIMFSHISLMTRESKIENNFAKKIFSVTWPRQKKPLKCSEELEK